MRHQQVPPRLGADRCRVIRSVLAPPRSGSSLGLNFLSIDVGSGLGFHHENGRIRFRHEVRDVLRLLSAQLVENLELALGGLEPLRRVALQDGRAATIALLMVRM